MNDKLKSHLNLDSITNKFILINLIIFVITAIFPDFIFNNFALFESGIPTYQFVTHMFLHAGLLHIGFNMLLLWMFGNPLESLIKEKKFLYLYFGAGFFSALLMLLLVDVQTGMVGASGALFGILASFTLFYPNEKVYIIFLPFWGFKIKYIFGLYLIYEIVMGILAIQGDTVGHFAHVGGAIFGLIYTIFIYRSVRPKKTKYY